MDIRNGRKRPQKRGLKRDISEEPELQRLFKILEQQPPERFNKVIKELEDEVNDEDLQILHDRHFIYLHI
jgi:hypothetical protein